MAKKPALSDITNIDTSADELNSNWDAIQAAFDNTVSLDGSTPNAFTADLDLNSNKILNVATPTTSGDGVNKAYVDSLIGGTLTIGDYSTVSSASALQAQAAVSGDVVHLLGLASSNDGLGGFFVFDNSNLSSQVSADGAQRNYIAPNFDLTGASGAWTRVRIEQSSALEKAQVEFVDIPSGRNGHAALRRTVDNNLALLYVMPRMSELSNSRPTGQVSGVKVFHDDYEQVDFDGDNNYRDGIFAAETDGGVTGFGRVVLRTNANGDFTTAGHPQIVFATTQDLEVMSITRLHPSGSVRGNYANSGGIYQVKEANPIWFEGLTVTAGDRVALYGRIYEAQNSGTCGSTRPVHDGVGGRQENSDGGTTTVGTSVDYLDVAMTGLSSGPFERGETVTGQASGETATVEMQYTTSELRLSGASGTFTDGETILGGTSGASATATTFTTTTQYTASDGAVTWLFLDDLKPSTSGNLLHDILTLGSGDPVVGFEGTQASSPIYVQDGQAIRFIRADGSEADFLLQRLNDTLRIHAIGDTTDNQLIELMAEDSDGDTLTLSLSAERATLEGGPFSNTPVSDTGTDAAQAVTSGLLNLTPASARTITSFTGISNGTRFTIRAGNANLTIADNASISTTTGSNYTFAANEVRDFVVLSTNVYMIGER